MTALHIDTKFILCDILILTVLIRTSRIKDGVHQYVSNIKLHYLTIIKHTLYLLYTSLLIFISINIFLTLQRDLN